MDRPFIGLLDRYGNGFQSTFITPRGPANVHRGIFNTPDMGALLGNGLALFGVNDVGTIPANTGIVMDRFRLWISGDATQAAAGPAEIILQVADTFARQLVTVGIPYLPAAAPASPPAHLYDSGWFDFGPAGLGWFTEVGLGGVSGNWYLKGPTFTGGSVAYCAMYHIE